MRILITLISIFSLSGCVGITTFGKTSLSECSFNTCNVEYPPTSKPTDVSAKTGMIQLHQYVTTKEEVQSVFGSPNKKVLFPTGSREIWLYNSGLSWSGFTLWAGIGIPLGAPIGHLHRAFTFEGNLLTNVEKEKTSRKDCHLIESHSMCW